MGRFFPRLTGLIQRIVALTQQFVNGGSSPLTLKHAGVDSREASRDARVWSLTSIFPPDAFLGRQATEDGVGQTPSLTLTPSAAKAHRSTPGVHRWRQLSVRRVHLLSPPCIGRGRVRCCRIGFAYNAVGRADASSVWPGPGRSHACRLRLAAPVRPTRLSIFCTSTTASRPPTRSNSAGETSRKDSGRSRTG